MKSCKWALTIGQKNRQAHIKLFEIKLTRKIQSPFSNALYGCLLQNSFIVVFFQHQNIEQNINDMKVAKFFKTTLSDKNKRLLIKMIRTKDY